jgi:substrate import-associated zinc metallohydrolase lipoprotein
LLGLGGDTWTKGTIDKWLYDTMTKPYNIDVKYRWDPWEVALDATLVPPEESKVIPAMAIVKQIWIDPYNAETGSENFIKKYAPKTFVLVGSPQYEFNGEILATAEGGNKIVMFVINRFDKNNIEELRRMLHTIQHEFAHILHQNILYPQEFKTITPGYTSTWFNISEADAQSQGFVTSYSMDNPDDDFVETVATMLIEGRARFNELVAAQNPTAQSLLRRKEQIVVDYYKKAWNIDFYSLQTRTQQALARIAAPQPPAFYIGFDKVYTSGLFSTVTQGFVLPASNNFLTIYNNANAAINSLSTPALPGLTLDYIEANFTTATIFSLKVHLIDDDENKYEAVFSYTFTKDLNNTYDFMYVTEDENGAFIKAAVQPLLDYFNNNTFKVDWFLDPNVTIFPRVTFTPQQTVNASFTALLN